MSDVSDLKRHTGPANRTAVLESSAYEAPPEILYAGEEHKGSLFVDYLRTIGRYKWLIATLGVFGIIGSILLNFTALPVYRARTSLDIQSLNSDFMNMKNVAPTEGAGDTSSDAYVQTQIKLLQSDALIDRTIQRLESEPHPDYIDQMDLASRIERKLYLVRSKQIPYDKLIEDTSHHVVVKALGVTRLVEITCDSWSSEYSAKFCNTLVDQFREGDLEMRGNESQKTSEYLTKQVADVKLKAEESQRRLEAATGGNNLILDNQGTGVEEERLRQMQGEYVRAEADRMQKEAAAAIGSSASPDLEQSAKYHQDEQKLADLKVKVAEIVPPLTEENDKVIHLRSQIREVEADMATQRANNGAHLKADYDAAVRREQMLAGAYHHEEGLVSSDLGKASQVALLKREVDSEQQLYQTLLGLAREAGFASAIHASNVRVVDAAKPAGIPFTPRRGASAASGLLLGTLCGVGLAFIMERNTTVFRVPGDTERFLGLRELGVIPSSERGRKAIPAGPLGNQNAELIAPQENQTPLSNWTENYSIVAEAYRSATTSIMLSEHPRDQGRVYVLSSPNAGEGKTTVISNLGVALSKSRLRVLLIDGDLRKPALHRVLQVPNEFGFRNLLRGETAAAPSVPTTEGVVPNSEASVATAVDPSDPTIEFPCYQPTSLPNLFVIPAGQGSEEVTELLHSSYTSSVIKRLRNEFDVVIIDTPPMLHMADTRILASHAQGAILVVRAGMTTRDEASKARDLFDQDRVRMVGTILNDFNPAKNGLSDYYKSYYRYMEDSSATTGAASWLEGLLSRERKVVRRRPIADTSSMAEAEEIFDYEDEPDFVDELGFGDASPALPTDETKAAAPPVADVDAVNGVSGSNTHDDASSSNRASSYRVETSSNGVSHLDGTNGVAGTNPATNKNGASSNGAVGSNVPGSNTSSANGKPARTPKRRRTRALPANTVPDPLEVVVSKFFTKMFNPGAPETKPMNAPPLAQSDDIVLDVSAANGGIYEERTGERRKTRRREMPQLVAYYWDGGAPRKHDIRDISSNGFYLLTEERWYPGTQVMILLQRLGEADTSPDRSITVNAEVVRFGTDGIGFSLVVPDKHARRAAESGNAIGADREAFQRFLHRVENQQG